MSIPVIKRANTVRCQSISDIMESIALEQCALSHILNAEGEKLQKAIACADDLDELLCVNHSVEQTITKVTQLEHVLYAKLAALTDCAHPCP
ncbi:MAG: hypothetical protein RRY97_07430, partial [Oscillibacter sp.]